MQTVSIPLISTAVVTNTCVGATCQTIEKITVTDGNCTLSPDPSVEFCLGSGANKTFTCSISGTPGQQDVPNTANASGTAALTKDIVTATGNPSNTSNTCDIPDCPKSLGINKTCVDADNCVDTVDFTVVVTNTCVGATGQ